MNTATDETTFACATNYVLDTAVTWVCAADDGAAKFSGQPCVAASSSAAACDTVAEKAAVYALSLVIVKCGGEKSLKYLLERVLTKVPASMTDLILFGFEINMSLQARLLMLSTPYPEIIFAASVLTGLPVLPRAAICCHVLMPVWSPVNTR